VNYLGLRQREDKKLPAAGPQHEPPWVPSSELVTVAQRIWRISLGSQGTDVRRDRLLFLVLWLTGCVLLVIFCLDEGINDYWQKDMPEIGGKYCVNMEEPHPIPSFTILVDATHMCRATDSNASITYNEVPRSELYSSLALHDLPSITALTRTAAILEDDFKLIGMNFPNSTSNSSMFKWTWFWSDFEYNLLYPAEFLRVFSLQLLTPKVQCFKIDFQSALCPENDKHYLTVPREFGSSTSAFVKDEWQGGYIAKYDEDQDLSHLLHRNEAGVYSTKSKDYTHDALLTMVFVLPILLGCLIMVLGGAALVAAVRFWLNSKMRIAKASLATCVKTGSYPIDNGNFLIYLKKDECMEDVMDIMVDAHSSSEGIRRFRDSVDGKRNTAETPQLHDFYVIDPFNNVLGLHSVMYAKCCYSDDRCKRLDLARRRGADVEPPMSDRELRQLHNEEGCSSLDAVRALIGLPFMGVPLSAEEDEMVRAVRIAQAEDRSQGEGPEDGPGGYVFNLKELLCTPCKCFEGKGVANADKQERDYVESLKYSGYDPTPDTLFGPGLFFEYIAHKLAMGCLGLFVQLQAGDPSLQSDGLRQTTIEAKQREKRKSKDIHQSPFQDAAWEDEVHILADREVPRGSTVLQRKKEDRRLIKRLFIQIDADVVAKRKALLQMVNTRDFYDEETRGTEGSAVQRRPQSTFSFDAVKQEAEEAEAAHGCLKELLISWRFRLFVTTLLEVVMVTLTCGVCAICQVWVAASDYNADYRWAQHLMYAPYYMAVALLALEVFLCNGNTFFYPLPCRVLRYGYYVLMLLLGCVLCWFLLVIAMWVLVGMLVDPDQVLPIGVGVIATFATLGSARAFFQAKVSRITALVLEEFDKQLEAGVKIAISETAAIATELDAEKGKLSMDPQSDFVSLSDKMQLQKNADNAANYVDLMKKKVDVIDDWLSDPKADRPSQETVRAARELREALQRQVSSLTKHKEHFDRRLEQQGDPTAVGRVEEFKKLRSILKEHEMRDAIKWNFEITRGRMQMADQLNDINEKQGLLMQLEEGVREVNQSRAATRDLFANGSTAIDKVRDYCLEALGISAGALAVILVMLSLILALAFLFIYCAANGFLGPDGAPAVQSLLVGVAGAVTSLSAKENQDRDTAEAEGETNNEVENIIVAQVRAVTGKMTVVQDSSLLEGLLVNQADPYTAATDIESEGFTRMHTGGGTSSTHLGEGIGAGNGLANQSGRKWTLKKLVRTITKNDPEKFSRIAEICPNEDDKAAPPVIKVFKEVSKVSDPAFFQMQQEIATMKKHIENLRRLPAVPVEFADLETPSTVNWNLLAG